EIRGTGVNRATTETVFTPGKIAQHRIGIHITHAGEEVLPAVHDRVTADHVHDAGHRIQGHVFSQDLGCVLGADETGFEHRETCRHPHYQRTAHQEIEGVHCVLQFINIVF